ncbi:MAG: TIR domain-containing protein [Thermodesulfobacteriota bacterium]
MSAEETRVPGFDLVCELQGHRGTITEIEWSPSGESLASGSRDTTVRIWEPPWHGSPTVLAVNRTVFSVSWSPCGEFIAVGTFQEAGQIWSTRDKTARKLVGGPDDTIYAVSWSPDGGQVAAGGYKGSVGIWNSSTGTLTRVLEPHPGYNVYCLKWSPSGALLASGAYGGHVCLWETASWQLLGRLSGDFGSVYSLSWTADDSELVSAGDGGVWIWDAATGAPLKHIRSHRRSVGGASISPDGSLVASQSRDGSTYVWECDSFQVVAAFAAHSAKELSNCVAFHPSGVRLAAPKYYERIVRIWDLRPELMVRRKISEVQGRTIKKPGVTDDSRPRLTQPRKRKPRPFLCYAKEDFDDAEEAYRQLVEAGFDPWFDDKKLLGGDEWEAKIEEAIRTVDCVIVFLSRHSVGKTGYVQRETRLALDAADRRPPGSTFVIPVKLEDVEIPSRLAKWHCVELHKPGGTARLLQSLLSLTGG